MKITFTPTPHWIFVEINIFLIIILFWIPLTVIHKSWSKKTFKNTKSEPTYCKWTMDPERCHIWFGSVLKIMVRADTWAVLRLLLSIKFSQPFTLTKWAWDNFNAVADVLKCRRRHLLLNWLCILYTVLWICYEILSLAVLGVKWSVPNGILAHCSKSRI